MPKRYTLTSDTHTIGNGAMLPAGTHFLILRDDDTMPHVQIRTLGDTYNKYWVELSTVGYTEWLTCQVCEEQEGPRAGPAPGSVDCCPCCYRLVCDFCYLPAQTECKGCSEPEAEEKKEEEEMKTNLEESGMKAGESGTTSGDSGKNPLPMKDILVCPACGLADALIEGSAGTYVVFMCTDCNAAYRPTDLRKKKVAGCYRCPYCSTDNVYFSAFMWANTNKLLDTDGGPLQGTWCSECNADEPFLHVCEDYGDGLCAETGKPIPHER